MAISLRPTVTIVSQERLDFDDLDKWHCANCYEHVFTCSMEYEMCKKCIEEIWNVLLNEETKPKGTEAENSIIVEAL